MSRSFVLGSGTPCNVDALIDTRLLIQANSGGGKSWCLRRVLEQTHGAVQHLVIDPEGEFASLRERFDYVLAARSGGDTAADPRTAKLLAERLLELGVSAILDIYELKAHERIRFVRYFLEALVDAPKKLWHPALVVVDEAHVYAPQQGEAESASAVIDLCTRGRKRGFCAALATQRLSKLHKDAAAELNNKLIGRTGLDVDVKRAADELGFGKERWRELRELEAGAFFAFGPAIAREVRSVTIGPVQTTHPKAGARLAFVVPPPTAKVKALLPKLADLPAEAAGRERTLAELQKDLADTRRALTVAQRAAPAPVVAKVERVEVPVLTPGLVSRLEAAVEREGKAAARHGDALGHVLTALDGLRNRLDAVRRPDVLRVLPARPVASAGPARAAVAPRTPSPGTGVLDGPERKLLTALAQHGQQTVTALALLTGYASSGGGFRNPLSRLRTKGCVEGTDPVRATDAGLDALGDWTPLPTGAALLHHWLGHLPGPDSKLLREIAGAYPGEITVEDLASATGYEVSGGAFRNPLSRLRTLNLVTGRTSVRASKELFA